jgi:hypothetical protein
MGERVLAVVDLARPDAAMLERLVTGSPRRYGTVDVVAVSRSRNLLKSLAVTAGATWESLEADEAAELGRSLQALVARLPMNLGIRSRICPGRPDQVVAGLVETSSYDVVLIAGGVRPKRRLRARLRRLAPGTELIFGNGNPTVC